MVEVKRVASLTLRGPTRDAIIEAGYGGLGLWATGVYELQTRGPATGNGMKKVLCPVLSVLALCRGGLRRFSCAGAGAPGADDFSNGLEKRGAGDLVIGAVDLRDWYFSDHLLGKPRGTGEKGRVVEPTFQRLPRTVWEHVQVVNLPMFSRRDTSFWLHFGALQATFHGSSSAFVFLVP
jgi:hypothetical protein